MIFDNGSVSGVMRVNTSGWADGTQFSFQGKYQFDSTKPSVGLPEGMITLHFDSLQNHYWDYAKTTPSLAPFALAWVHPRKRRPGHAEISRRDPVVAHLA